MVPHAIGTQLDACVDVLPNLAEEVHNLDHEKPDSTNQAGLRRRGERGLEEKPHKLLEGGRNKPESVVVAMSHCNFSHKICSRQRDTATLSHGKTETSQFVSQI